MFPDEEDFHNTIQQPIRTKVTTVIKYWLDKCGWNFDEKLISQLNDFIDGPLSRDGNLSSLKQLRGSLIKLQKRKAISSDRADDKILSSYPEPKLPSTAKLFLKPLAVRSLDDVEVARQLSLIDMAKFQKTTVIFCFFSITKLLLCPFFKKKKKKSPLNGSRNHGLTTNI